MPTSNAGKVDGEFRSAIKAFLRDWQGEDFFERGYVEEQVERIVDEIGNSFAELFREFHDEHGRYPKFGELFPPGGPVIGMLSDMK